MSDRRVRTRHRAPEPLRAVYVASALVTPVDVTVGRGFVFLNQGVPKGARGLDDGRCRPRRLWAIRDGRPYRGENPVQDLAGPREEPTVGGPRAGVVSDATWAFCWCAAVQ